jgi:hypothetical protein
MFSATLPRGHTNESFKVDSCLTAGDAHVVSGSEDGKVYFWDLVGRCMSTLDCSLLHPRLTPGCPQVDPMLTAVDSRFTPG